MDDRVRTPVVAGMFYPGRRDDLRLMVGDLLGELPPVAAEPSSIGLIVPHAGYPYSGRVAGQAFRRAFAHGRPDTIIVLGANHSGLGGMASLSMAGAWRTPLGDVAVDREVTTVLGSAGVTTFDAAFRSEHSIEVQLPLLQGLWASPPPIVPICVQTGPLGELHELEERLASATEGRTIWVVASSDFTHYEPDAVARARDRAALDAILAGNADGFYAGCRERRASICGVGAITALLALARRRGWTRSTLIAYETSGDATGDRAAVVGYAAVSLTEKGDT